MSNMNTKETIEAQMQRYTNMLQILQDEHTAGKVTAIQWNLKRREIAMKQIILNNELLDIDVKRWRDERDNLDLQLCFF